MGEIHKRFHDLAIRLSIYSSILDFGLMLSALLVGYRIFPKQFSSTLLFIFTNAIAYITLAIVVFFLLAFIMKNRARVVNIKITSYRPVFPLLNRGHFTPPSVRKVKVYTVDSWTGSAAQPAESVKISYPSVLKRGRIDYMKNNGEVFVNLNGTWLAAGKDRFLKVKRPYLRPQ